MEALPPGTPDEDAPELRFDSLELVESTDETGPQRRRFVVSRELRKRIDIYLHQRLKGISRNKVQELIDQGGVTINDKLPKASTLLHEGDVVDVILPPPALREIVPEPIPLTVLYEDDAFIVLNKQANLIVHPARGQNRGTMLNGLAYHFQQKMIAAGHSWQPYHAAGFSKGMKAEGENNSLRRRTRAQRLGEYKSRTDPTVPGLSAVGAEGFRPGIVHRLDKNTTGVIVVAKSDAAHWQIARQFEYRTTLKAYLAIVHGNFKEPSGVIDEPMGKHPTIREAYAIRRDTHGKQAITLFRVREQYRGFALVELELKTGRTHQIRVHLSYLGHPIIGDIVYGGEPLHEGDFDQPPTPAGARKYVTFARSRDDGLAIESRALKKPGLLIAHPALHAAFLRFTHPFTQTPMTFTAPVHEPMCRLIHDLRTRPNPDAPVMHDGTWIDLKQAVPQSENS